jgi:succinate dehydrogenase/fumarate reductase flavoprotein subunit
MRQERVPVLIVGGGGAGLTAVEELADALRRILARPVAVAAMA